MRVALLGFHHESNTFAPVAASLDQFLAAGPVEGDGLLTEYAESQATLAGFIEAAAADDEVDLVPLVYFDLNPMGTITAEAFETLVGRMVRALDDGGPWDAVLLALHGAAVSEVHRDADGEILERVRGLVGPDVTIGVTLDMHANVSARMIDQADVVNLYMTNPHLDPRVRAAESARLVFRTVRGEIRPVMAMETPPLIVNILRQGTSDSPMRELVGRAAEAATRPGVLSVSIAEGFPYADVAEMGMTFLAVTDDDPDLARGIARELARAAWDVRFELDGDGVAVDDALRQADQAAGRPDPSSCSTWVTTSAEAARPTRRTSSPRPGGWGSAGSSSRCATPAPSPRARPPGSGRRWSSRSAARPTCSTGSPVPVRGTVRTLDDGRFEDTGPTHGGKRFFDAGPWAVVETEDGYTLLLTSRPMGNMSRQELVSAGIDPLRQPIIVAKGVHSPRGAFEPIAAAMIQLNSPGCTSADVTALPYRHRRRPMFPYEPDTQY